MNRSLSELEVRATLPLSRAPQGLREKCVAIARKKSPSAAFNLAASAAMLSGLSQIESLCIAKAARWLSVIRRDHGQEAFDRVAASLDHAHGNTATGTTEERKNEQ